MTKWGTLLHRVFQDAELSDPVVAKDLGGVEAALGVRLPADLSGCLDETNGASALYGTAILWSAAEIVERNREMRDTEDFRDLYMPFDALLFVGEGGNGDLFGYRVLVGGIKWPDLYRWDHEDDSRTWFARDLEDYLRRLADPAVM